MDRSNKEPLATPRPVPAAVRHEATGAAGPTLTPPGDELPLRRRLRGVGVLAAAHAINDAYAYVLQAILPAIIPALGLTLGLAGGLVALYQVTSSLLQPFVGYLADRSRLRWPAWAGVALSGLAAGSLGLAPHYLVLVGVLILGGIGTAIFHPVSAAMVGAAAPARTRGRWLGLYITAGNFGLALGPLMASPLLERYGPAGTWPIMLPALVMTAFVFALAPPRRPPSGRPLPLGELFRRHRRVISSLVLVAALRSWAGTALITFIPLLAQLRGLGLGEAAQVLTVYLVSGALGSLVGGLVADRWGRDRVLVGSLLLSVPFGLYVALSGDAGFGFLAAAACGGFFLNGSFVVLTIRAQESVPGSIGMMTGLILGLSIGLGGLAVAPLALLSESIGIPSAAALAASLGGAAALAMRTLPPLPNAKRSDQTL